MSSDPFASNSWPDAVGDVAVFPGIRTTNGITVHTQNTITVGEMLMITGTHCWVGDDWLPSTLVFDNSNQAARIRIDRAKEDGYMYSGLGIWGSTRVDFVGDIEIITRPLPSNLAMYATCAVFRIEDDVVIKGSGRLLKDGAGMLWVGGQADGAYFHPQILLDSPLVVQDGWLCVYPEAIIEPAVQINSDARFTHTGQCAIDVDVILNGGMYWPNFANQSRYTNCGSVTVLDPSCIRANSNACIFLEGEVNGTSELINDMNGIVNIVGTISPGLGPSNCIGKLTITTRLHTQSIIGLADNQATLEVDVDEPSVPSGADYDELICNGRTTVELGYMNLLVRLGNFTPEATCTVVIASPGAVHGEFSSVQWEPPEYAGSVVCDDSSVTLIMSDVPEPMSGVVALALCVYGFRASRSRRNWRA